MSILALWATPRTVSTAFERMMIERGDHLVLDEPWSRAYYFGPDRRSPRYPLSMPESTYDAVTTSVLELGSRDEIFVKDMAYQALPAMTDALIGACTHTFLIRDPRLALASLRKEWPDHTADEAGYSAQRTLFDRVRSVDLAGAVVIDSDRLRRDPAGVIAAWCARVGIEPMDASLTWEAGMRPEWPLWQSWYRNVAESTGFAPLLDRDAAPPERDDPSDLALRDALVHYEHLAPHAI